MNDKELGAARKDLDRRWSELDAQWDALPKVMLMAFSFGLFGLLILAISLHWMN